MKAPTLPAIHINDMNSQADEYRTAYQAATKALDALSCTCNFREFYQDDAAWEKSLSERSEMFRGLAAAREFAKAWMDWANSDDLAIKRHALGLGDS